MIPTLQMQPLPWQLSFVTEFWDARVGISQADATERVSAWAGRKGFATLSQATAGNQPLLLPYSGTNYCWNNAVAGNTLSTPNVSITGNWTLTFDFAAADYTPGSDITLCDKSSGLNGFKVSLLTTGVIRVTIGDGAALTNFDSSVANGQTDFSRHTFQIVYTDNTNVKFYVDGAQLGTTVTVNKVLTNAATAFLLGPWDGKLYSYSLTNSVATTYYGKTLSALPEGSANFTDDTGATVTFNSTGAKPAQIVGSQQLLFDGSAHYLDASFTLNQPNTLALVGKQVSWTANEHILNTPGGSNVALFQVGSTPAVGIYAGVTNIGSTTAWAIGTNAVIAWGFNGASSFTQVNLGTPNTGNPGTANMSGVRLGASQLANANANIQCKSLAVCNTALSSTQLRQLINSINSQYWVF